jgi:hypothetical protein
VKEIINNKDILVVVALDKADNVVGACTGEPDKFGGIEVSEFFASKSAYSDGSCAKEMLLKMIELCKKTFLHYKFI